MYSSEHVWASRSLLVLPVVVLNIAIRGLYHQTGLVAGKVMFSGAMMLDSLPRYIAIAIKIGRFIFYYTPSTLKIVHVYWN